MFPLPPTKSVHSKLLNLWWFFVSSARSGRAGAAAATGSPGHMDPRRCHLGANSEHQHQVLRAKGTICALFLLWISLNALTFLHKPVAAWTKERGQSRQNEDDCIMPKEMVKQKYGRECSLRQLVNLPENIDCNRRIAHAWEILPHIVRCYLPTL